jgi:hypothetical protein
MRSGVGEAEHFRGVRGLCTPHNPKGEKGRRLAGGRGAAGSVSGTR